MKTFLYSLLMLCAFSFTARAGRVIKNPAVDFQKSGIIYVTQVELCDTATLVTFKTRFVPHWWVDFTEKDYIKDCETGQKYQMTGLIGGKMGDQIYMGDSGDSTFVGIFPPISKSIKKIDYSEYVFGISLVKLKQPKEKSYDEQERWLASKMPSKGQPVLPDFNSPQFFKQDTAHLYGYLKGYDPRCGLKTGIVYCSDELTRQDYPITIRFEDDGRFEAHLPLHYPKTMYLIFDRKRVPVYVEPGQTVGLILDWEDFLLADRYRNIIYPFKLCLFKGALAAINEELAAFDAPMEPYNDFEHKVQTLKPGEFVNDRMTVWDEDLARLEKYAAENKISFKAETLLNVAIQLKHGEKLFDYVRIRKYEAQRDGSNLAVSAPLPGNYYDFLKRMDLNNPALLTGSDFSGFINRFEYMGPFEQVERSPVRSARTKPAMNFLEYLTHENVPITDQERKFLGLALKEEKTEEEMEKIKADSVVGKQIFVKFEKERKAYNEKYFPSPSNEDKASDQLVRWHRKEAVLLDSLGLQPGLAFEIAEIRSLRFWLDVIGKDAAPGYWEKLKQGISQPFLVYKGDRLLAELFPDEPVLAYELPKGEATDVFRKIIGPHKGKILFVDFWATSCGPCVGGIKRMKETRAERRNDPDIDFVFVTDERSSPEEAYNKFVEEQELVHTYRLSTDDYYLLRELFKFNGIPHYVVIDKEGRVLDDNFRMYNFKHELPKILGSVSSL